MSAPTVRHWFLFFTRIRLPLSGIVLFLAFLVPSLVLGATDNPGALHQETGRTFSIQTATFAPLNLAKRHVERIASAIPKQFLTNLRIEDTGKYHTVRFGSFGDLSEAEKALEALRPRVSDAFILNEDGQTDSRTVFLYPDLAAEAGPFTIDAGTFPTLRQARELFDRIRTDLAGSSIVERLQVLRKEDVFFVRVDPLRDFDRAKEALRAVRAVAHQAALKRHDPDEKAALLLEGGTGRPASTDSVAPGPAETNPADAPSEPEDGDPAPPGRFDPARQVKTFDEIDREMADLMAGREYGKAIALIKSAIQQWPENPELHAWYGNVLLTMDRPDKAVQSFRKAADLAPAVPEYQSDLGHSLLYVHMDTAREAIRVFQRALALDPENSDALEGLGTVYVSIGRQQEAESVYRELEKIDTAAAERLDKVIRYGVDWKR